MSLSEINATCTKCKINFSSLPTRSFLGFQKLICPNCQEKITYPLTKGFRSAYQILFCLMIIAIFGQLAQGVIGYPGGIGIAIMYALYRDRSIQKKVLNIEPNPSTVITPTISSQPMASDERIFSKKILSILSVIALLIAGAIGSGIGEQVGKSMFFLEKSTSNQMQDALMEAARQINSRGPVMIDQDTRMDGATVEAGERLIYHYTFPDYSSKNIDPKMLIDNLQPSVRKSVCADKKIRLSMKYGSTYVYSYSGNDGVKIVSFDVTKKDCGL